MRRRESLEKQKRVLEAQRIARELAEEHWMWVERWLHMVYVDAFVHGYKHGKSDE